MGIGQLEEQQVVGNNSAEEAGSYVHTAVLISHRILCTNKVCIRYAHISILYLNGHYTDYIMEPAPIATSSAVSRSTCDGDGKDPPFPGTLSESSLVSASEVPLGS